MVARRGIEVKSIEGFDRGHMKQVISYLRQLDLKVGLVIKFNVAWLVQDGLKRVRHQLSGLSQHQSVFSFLRAPRVLREAVVTCSARAS